MTASKIVLNAASGVGGAGLDVEEVFSTFLYTGNNTANRVINNGIDLAGEGGIVWTKIRYPAGDNSLWTTDIGAGYRLLPNETNAKITDGGLTSFNNNGFTIQDNSSTNPNNNTMASWTFRKAPKFFDVVTYSGTGSAGLTVNHNLGSVPGCIWVKRLDAGDGFQVYHRGSNASAPEDYKASLNDTAAFSNDTMWNDFAPTATQFQLGARDAANRAGTNYVAYLFAHNDGDGEFGPDGNADIIKCGTYEGNGGTQEIALGFEPQWVMIKNIESRSYQSYLDWNIFDNMREFANRTSGDNDVLIANGNDAETALARCFPTANGFAFYNDGAYSLNTSGDTYIYIAIRRGTKVPESATEVFAMDTFGGTSPTPPSYVSGFPVDMVIQRHDKNSTSDPRVNSRLTGINFVYTSQSSSETYDSGYTFDYMNGFRRDTGTDANDFTWMWKRAPNYMDCVAYTGNGTAGRTVSHNLSVAPEMMWVKGRSIVEPWVVYHKGLNGGVTPQNYHIRLTTGVEAADSDIWNNTAPTSSAFTTGGNDKVNANNQTYIAYLFASLAGISKVGSVTHSGTTNVDCGFSSGARFVLLKRPDATGDWYVWDSERGIVSGNDPYLALNSTAAEVTNTDYIDPLSSGFTITSSFTAGDYIFYAIA